MAAQLPHDPADYPEAPWRLVGSMWLTVFRLPEADAVPGRPAGTYGAAFVSYTEGSPLTYSELLVARPVPRRDRAGRGASITDIWVDSAASRAGGRELWAIPKELGDFDLETTHRGPLSTTDWGASLARRPIASATFRDVSRAGPRVPFRGRIAQPGLAEGGGPGDAPVRGTAKVLPARARWDLAPDGPLAFLRGARALASFRLASFRMSFG